MNRVSLVVAGCCLVILSAACDAAKTSTTGAGSNNIAITALQASLADAVCASAAKCPGVFPFTFASPATCVAIFAGQLTDFTDLISEVQSGKIAYDGAQAAQCVATIRNSCSFFDAQKAPPGCDKTFVGSTADGAACQKNEECKSAFCNQTSQDCPGVCAPQVASGAACKQSQECSGTLVCSGGKCVDNLPSKKGGSCDNLICDTGLYCDSTTANPVCAELVAIGAPCSGGGNGGTKCAGDGLCSTDIKTGASTCVARAKLGDTCGGPGATDCEAGLVCVPNDKGASACVTRAKLGEACTSTFQCGTIDTVCGTSGKCEVLPAKGAACTCDVGSKGGSCDAPAGQLYSCMPPFVCDATSKLCIDAPGKDQPCGQGKCALGLTCISNVCKAPAASGEACDPNMGINCAKGLTCGADKKCAAPVCK